MRGKAQRGGRPVGESKHLSHFSLFVDQGPPN